MDKEKMKMIAIYTASFVPGWNIACWSVGLGLYCLTDIRKNDAKACRFAKLVLAAPATLPVMAFEKLTDRAIL